MNENERIVASWHAAAHDYGHAAEALGLEPFAITDESDGHQVATAFALRVAQVLATSLVDMHIADVHLRGNKSAADSIAQTVMTLLPGPEADHGLGGPIPVEDLLEALLRAYRERESQ